MSIPTTSLASPLSRGTEVRINDDDDENDRKTNLSLLFHRYKERFMNLTKGKGWMSESQYLYQGHWFPSNNNVYAIESVMAMQDTFEANPRDIYLATPPKSGTTWLKALSFAIVNRTKYTNNSLSTHPLLISNPHTCVPTIEREILRSRPTYIDPNSPRLFATHLPYTSLPQTIINSGCPLVYMCRNPKDVLVSLFHFANKLRDKSLGLLTLEEAVEMFSKGNSPCGPYWDHVKGYYNASLQQPTRILFLTYENMKMDTANNVKRLAEFLGYHFTKEEEAKGVVEEIVSLCSFKNLSEVNKHGNYREGVPNNAFFREGKVGDWTNHLTYEIRRILDQITKEKFHGMDIVF